jgi:hypothetical protein
MTAKCFSHLFLHNLIILIIFWDEYKSWSSLRNILLSSLFSDTLSLCSFLNVENGQNYSFIYFNF